MVPKAGLGTSSKRASIALNFLHQSFGGNDTAQNDEFGSSIAIDTDTVAVGAPRKQIGGVEVGGLHIR